MMQLKYSLLNVPNRNSYVFHYKLKTVLRFTKITFEKFRYAFYSNGNYYIFLANGNGDYFCGGALIHKNYVVTGIFLFVSYNKIKHLHFNIYSAAHCISSSFLRKNRYSITSIRLGEHDLSSERDCEEVPKRLHFVFSHNFKNGHLI